MHNRRLPRLLMAAALGLTPILSAALSFAQVPPPVPALPDAERRTTYSISASTCACAVNFALFGSGTDVDSWIEVFVAGTRYLSTDPSHGWALTSATGTLATIPRPITNAVLTFALPQTGTIQIVGANRPRRLSQFQENAGVSARNLNQVITDILAQNRETWDKINDVTGRGFFAPPGSVGGIITGPLTGVIGAPASATANGLARWNGTTGAILKDSPLATLSDNGTLTINPAAGIIPGLTINQSLSGSTLPTGNAANLFFIQNDSATAGAAFLQGLQLTWNMNSPLITGGRQGIAAFLTQSSATAAGNPNRNYVAATFQYQGTSGDGGTNTGAGALGAGFGVNPFCWLQSGSLNMLNCSAGEADIAIATGASAKYKSGWSIVDHTLDKVHGATLDAGLVLSGQVGAIGLNTGITFSDYAGQHMVISTGTLINSTGGTFANFVDWSASICTNKAWQSTGFVVDCSGNITSGAWAGTTIPLNKGGTGTTTVPGIQTLLNMAQFTVVATAVNFNSANTDTSIAVTLPTGVTNYRVANIQIGNASASISTATYGLFSAAAGAGTAVIAGGSGITVTTASANTNNNIMTVAPPTAATQSYNFATLFFRVGTAQGSAATADVVITIVPVP